MRVKQITVNKLFGMFNHTIPLNQEERITIIHGPNGFGKTTLLRLLNAVLAPDYSVLAEIPFENFQITFDNHDSITVTKAVTKKSIPPNRKGIRRLVYIDDIDDIVGTDTETTIIISLSESGGKKTDFKLTERLKEQTNSNSVVKFGDLIIPIDGHSITSVSLGMKKDDCLTHIRQAMGVWYIHTQRLVNIPSVIRHGIFRDKPSSNAPTLVVSSCSEELAATIKTKLEDYANLSESLERTFPARLVRLMAEPHLSSLTDDELRGKLAALEEKRLALTAVGVLDRTNDATPPIDEITEDNKRVLAVYATDAEKKLGVFDELESKLELFKKIINSRFLFKQMSLSKDTGITFTTEDSQSLALNSLSSGEQHELILFYQLLFKVRPNSLVLIDEPEISLHVSWQEQFLRDIQKVAQLSEFDVLIATHSPEIIADKWDLTVALEKPHKLPSNNSHGKQKRQRQSAVTVR